MPSPISLARLLQFALPQAQARAIAAAAIGGHEEARGLGIAGAAKRIPPAPDAVHRKGRGVMVNADAHPPGIGGDVIDPIRHRPTELLDEEIVDLNLFRSAFRPPLAAGILEIADQFLLLGIDRNYRLLRRQSLGHLVIDVAKLRVAVGMA